MREGKRAETKQRVPVKLLCNIIKTWILIQPTQKSCSQWMGQPRRLRQRLKIPSKNSTLFSYSKSQVVLGLCRRVQRGLFFHGVRVKRGLQGQELRTSCSGPHQMHGYARCTCKSIQLGRNILKEINRHWKLVVYSNLACCYHYTRKLSKCNKFCERIK